MGNKIVSAHQPNLFPWLGYFNKIKNSSIFVVLDDVQVPKTGGGVWNRIYLIINNQMKFLTAPYYRKGYKSFRDTYYVNNMNWRKKFIKSLSINYAKAPFFKKYKNFIFDLINYPSNNMFDYNWHGISNILQLLDIKTQILFSSSLKINKERKESKIIAICKKLDAKIYLSGVGAKKYQHEENFNKEGIKLLYQNFEHPEYTQFNTNKFIKGLSIIDAIFNIGEDVKEII